MSAPRIRLSPKAPWGILLLLILFLSSVSAIAELPSRSSASSTSTGREVAQVSTSGPITPAAQHWLSRSRAALSPDPRPLESIEIVAEYKYFTGEGQERILDLTRISLPSTLWQERHLEGGEIRRGIDAGGGFLESPRGKLELEADQQAELADYLCLRRLAFLSFCSGFQVDLDEQVEDRVWLRIERDGELFARLAIDRETTLPAVLIWEQKDLFSETERITTVFSSYRPVDGWLLPHVVESFSHEEPFYRYTVSAASLGR